MNETHMQLGDITITLTESQHEVLMDSLMHSLDSFQLVAPYDDGIDDLPLDNPVVQRYTLIQNLREMLGELWTDRFDPSEHAI